MSNAVERWFDRKQSSSFRELSQIQETFDRLITNFLNLKKANGMPDFSFIPSCELNEEENNYILTFDLPGVRKDQIEVETENSQLTVRAERQEEKKTGSQKTYLSEHYYGAYARTFALPGPIDEKKIDAKFENGVLTIVAPKMESVKSKQIQVH